MNQPDPETYSYMPTELFNNGWSRWMPSNAIYLYLILGTATVGKFDGSLDELCARFPVGDQLPRGAATPVLWNDPTSDQSEDDQRRVEHQRNQFHDAVAHLSAPPETIEDYARVLAKLGVFRHTTTPNGTQRWRVSQPMPLPTEVLRLPPEVAAEEDRMRWSWAMDDYAQPILSLLYETTPDRLDTTIDRFARQCEMDPESCRQGLLCLVGDGELIASRKGEPVDMERVPTHARIQLTPQWNALAENRIRIESGP